jgi:hypothetical protein
MKINEVTNIPRTYIATVRVVVRSSGMMARTTVTADTFQQARLILTRIYGEGNVLGISLSISESPETCQIQPEALNVGAVVRCSASHEKIGPAQASCVSEAGAGTRVLSPPEIQVKALSDRAKQLNQQAKQLKARQAVQKAQDKLRAASSAPKMSV